MKLPRPATGGRRGRRIKYIPPSRLTRAPPRFAIPFIKNPLPDPLTASDIAAKIASVLSVFPVGSAP